MKKQGLLWRNGSVSKSVVFLLVLVLLLAAIPAWTCVSAAAGDMTAWQNGQLVMDTAGVVERSNIILQAPNAQPIQSMPLGNGVLGAAAWSANGMTVQLNRADAFPDRKAVGQVVLSGLAGLTGASNYAGVVNLYDGIFTQYGNSMTASTYVRADKDELVVDVTGANPSQTQTVQVHLWSGRSPSTAASGSIATLAETWVDNGGPGSSGQTFGTLAALTANGQNVQASVVNSETVQVSFKPNADGSFRVLVGAPHWVGGNAMSTAQSFLGNDAQLSSSALSSAHLSWWHAYWSQVGLMKLSSPDNAAQYFENLRMINLYTAAAESRAQFPGSQAGVGDLFSYSQDSHQWVPSDYWEWNLRMQVDANLGAGAFALNTPYFQLYSQNLANIETWTSQHMPGHTGACVPETMRFNGNGYYGVGTGFGASNASCDSTISPSYNSLTLTSGSEVALWIWQQYLYTGDQAFLSTNYPVMSAVAQFLLSYAKMGSDGYLHTSPTNAHETQWGVNDSVTDIAAMQALFPVVIKAATLLGRDASLVSQLQAAIPHILPFPRTDTATQTQLLSASSDASGNDMIGLSSQPTASRHNVENLGLETNALNSSLPFASVVGQAATSYKAFGSVTIGLPGHGVVPTPSPTAIPTAGTTPTPSPTQGHTPTPTVGITPTATPTQGTTGQICSVQYAVTSQWPGGFGASVTITNTGMTAMNGWTLVWTFANGQTITQLWNGSYTQSGSAVSVSNASYNGAIAAGGTTSFGFNGSWGSSNMNPVAFTLNGTACQTG